MNQGESEFETECVEMLRELRTKREKIRKRLTSAKEQLIEVNADITAVKVSLRAYRRQHGLIPDDDAVTEQEYQLTPD